MLEPKQDEPLDVWLRQVDAIQFEDISMHVWVERPIRLSDSMNVVVRGLLGERLRHLTCLTGAPTCRGCPEMSHCKYASLFGTEDNEDAPKIFWLQGIPVHNELKPGAHFDARLITAQRTDEEKAVLKACFHAGLCHLGSRTDTTATILESRVGVRRPPALREARAWKLTVQSPLILRGDMSVCETLCPQAPWFALIARAGVRRLDSLLQIFTTQAERPRAQFPDLTQINLLDGNLRWWNGSRYSQRQNKRTPLKGLCGSVVLAGESVRQLMPLLEWLSVTNIGKATTMGFGEFKIEVLE